MRWFLRIGDPNASELAVAGGKGANLSKLHVAGFNVPDGFIITADAYRQHAPRVDLRDVDPNDLSALEQVASAARAQVRQASLSTELMRAVEWSLNELEGAPVAVRSSATAEDLPSASFAGQQESFLHVKGLEAVLQSVQECWASLWTARAIHYRYRMGFDHCEVALAVVVQAMAPHDVSGVAFTRNPVTRRADELLINAVHGTGDALVGGLKTPDQWVARRPDGAVLHFIAGDRGGPRGNPFQKGDLSGWSPSGCLSTAEVRTLAKLALRVETTFAGVPQDIEWSYGTGSFFLLQSRPITTN